MSDLQRDIELLEDLVAGDGLPSEEAAWQRIRARLTRDREAAPEELAKPDPADILLGDMSDAEVTAGARKLIADAKQKWREGAALQRKADLLRKELRRRKRAAKAGA